MFAVIDLFGAVETISVTSTAAPDPIMLGSQQSHSVLSDIPDSLEVGVISDIFDL